MTISMKPLSFYADSKEALNSTEKAYFRAKVRRKVHGMLLKRFSELSEDDIALRSLLAERLDVHRSQVTRWLASPSNLTIDTLSDLMLAMNREIGIASVGIGVDSHMNYSHPTSTLGWPDKPKAVTVATSNTTPVAFSTIMNTTAPKIQIK